MEPNLNGLPGGIFSGLGSTSGMLGLELPLQSQQNPQNSQNQHHLHHSQMVGFVHNHDHNNSQSQQQSAVKHGGYINPFASSSNAKPKPQSPHSDEDDSTNTSEGKRKVSPWQRMKWTDDMVRILIGSVYLVGDEVGLEGTNHNGDPTNAGKKKVSGVGGVVSQKKGKWKSVSRTMMEKGFCVSPQQCEDKFNDLNKRYKRVTDILGKGHACKVVENNSLLETMDLPPKLKEEVKKLLNSKHLFFKEMCAYHNSCSHGSNGVDPGSAGNHSTEVATEQSHGQFPLGSHVQQQRCIHSTGTNFGIETEGLKMARRARNEYDGDDSDDSDEDEDAYDEDDDDTAEGHSRGQNQRGHDQDEDDNDEKNARKRQRAGVLSLATSVMQHLNSELVSVIQDGTKSPWEKKHWMKLRLMQLEEQQVSYQRQAFELEKQRLKWLKFSSKKEREMERSKLDNQRTRLENERMVLLVKQKELELLDLQQQHHHQQQQISSNKRSDPSSITG